jgi:peptide/nickel transport system substrate-binding protein
MDMVGSPPEPATLLGRRRLLQLGGGVAAGGVLLPLLSGCGSNQPSSGPTSSASPVVKRGGSLVILQGDSFVGTLDPRKALALTDFQLLSCVTEPLLRADPASGDVIPGIGRSWKFSQDVKQLTITLRDGVRFSNGQPVTVQDVVASSKIWLDPKHVQSYLVANVEKCVPGDAPNTVVIHSSVPNEFVLYAMAASVFPVFPASMLAKGGEKFFAAPIGAGPFSVVSAKPDSYVLKRNPFYWKPGQPYLNQLEINSVSDPNQRLLQFNANDAGVVLALTFDQTSQVNKKYVKAVNSYSFAFLGVNWAKPTLGNVNFRKALSLAINRAALVQGVQDGYGQPCRTILSPYPTEPSPTNGSWSTFDLGQAKSLVAGSGYDGTNFDIVLDNSLGNFVTMASALVQQFADAGVKTTVKPLDTAAYYQAWAGPTYKGGNYELSLDLSYPVTGSPYEGLPGNLQYNWLFSNSDAESLAILRKTAKECASLSPTQMRPALQNLEDWAVDHVPNIPIATQPWIAAVASKVGGFQYSPVGYFNSEDLYLRG